MSSTEFNWEKVFPNMVMVRIQTIGDGSCFFHAVVNGFSKPYREGVLLGKKINRFDFIKKLRNELSEKLSKYYEYLSRGCLPSHAKELDKYSLTNLKRVLESNNSVDNMFQEYLSLMINKNILILDGEAKDVYVTGDDIDILFNEKNFCVVLYYENNHYDLVGIKQNTHIKTAQDDPLNFNIKTHFSPKDPFIIHILNRYNEKVAMGSSI